MARKKPLSLRDLAAQTVNTSPDFFDYTALLAAAREMGMVIPKKPLAQAQFLDKHRDGLSGYLREKECG